MTRNVAYKHMTLAIALVLAFFTGIITQREHTVENECLIPVNFTIQNNLSDLTPIEHRWFTRNNSEE